MISTIVLLTFWINVLKNGWDNIMMRFKDIYVLINLIINKFMVFRNTSLYS